MQDIQMTFVRVIESAYRIRYNPVMKKYILDFILSFDRQTLEELLPYILKGTSGVYGKLPDFAKINEAYEKMIENKIGNKIKRVTEKEIFDMVGNVYDKNLEYKGHWLDDTFYPSTSYSGYKNQLEEKEEYVTAESVIKELKKLRDKLRVSN